MKIKNAILALSAIAGLNCSLATAADMYSGIHQAASGTYPWMAAIVKRDVTNAFDGLVCEGTLIRKNWVLTAKHCLTDANLTAGEMDVVVNRSDLRATGGSRVHIAEIVLNPGDEAIGAGDLALIRLSTAVSVPPIEIVTPELFKTLATEGTPVRAIGWGTSSPSTSWRADPNFSNTWRSPVMMESDLSTVADSLRCPLGQNRLNDMCAGVTGDNTNIDACFEDGGGPLLLQNGSKWVVAGVSSALIGCAGRGISATYSGLAGAYNQNYTTINWINQVIKDRTSCGATPVYRYFNPFINDTYLSTDL